MDKRFPLEDQIAMLASFVRGKVLLPTDDGFADTARVAHANFAATPKAIVRVANAADVAAVINFADVTGLPLSVRGGGHSTAGHGVVDGGLVIDTRDLRSIELNVAGETGWFGAGLTAGEIIAAIEPRGFVIGFGDSATVGVAGITLGGGIGYMSRKLGLTHDALLAAEIVTASGDVLIIDVANHPDLFWAIRGGGGNFGVVTRLRFRLHRQAGMVGGPLVLPATAQNIARFAALSAAAPHDLSSIALVMPAPPLPFLPPSLHGQVVLMAMMAWSGAPSDADAALAPFRAIDTPLADLVGPMPYSALFIPEDPNMRMSCAIRSSFTGPVSETQAQSLIDSLARSDAPMRMAQIRVLGGAVSRQPADATAFAHRDATALVAILSLDPRPVDFAAQDRWVAESLAAFGPTHRGRYVNFLAAEGEDGVAATYPGETGERLRAIKKRYDPENLFASTQNILPA